MCQKIPKKNPYMHQHFLCYHKKFRCEKTFCVTCAKKTKTCLVQKLFVATRICLFCTGRKKCLFTADFFVLTWNMLRYVQFYFWNFLTFEKWFFGQWVQLHPWPEVDFRDHPPVPFQPKRNHRCSTPPNSPTHAKRPGFKNLHRDKSKIFYFYYNHSLTSSIAFHTPGTINPRNE